MKQQQFSPRWWGWWRAWVNLFAGLCLGLLDNLTKLRRWQIAWRRGETR